MEWSPQHQPSWLCFCLVASRWRWTAAAGCSVWWSRRPAQSTWTLATWRWGAPWRRAATWCCPPPSCQVLRDASSSVSSPTLPSGSGNQSRSGRTLWCNLTPCRPVTSPVSFSCRFWSTHEVDLIFCFCRELMEDLPSPSLLQCFLPQPTIVTTVHLHRASGLSLPKQTGPQNKKKKKNKKNAILNRVYIHC